MLSSESVDRLLVMFSELFGVLEGLYLTGVLESGWSSGIVIVSFSVFSVSF